MIKSCQNDVRIYRFTEICLDSGQQKLQIALRAKERPLVLFAN